ncbi:unnamed protein product [Urochloa humidicola]
MVRLGITEHPEYEGREYEEYGTERCEVIIRIDRSEEFPDIRPWRVTTTGFRFADTYQAAARKALRYLCQIYENPIARTSMRLSPPLSRDSPVWQSHMQALKGRALMEDDPTVVFMTRYLLTLDEHCDEQAKRLKRCIRRAEAAEVQIRQLRIRVTEAHARAAAAENREAIAVEALRLGEDRHTQQLKEAYLATQARRRKITMDGQQHPVLEGIPVAFVGKPDEGPSAPPPTEASREASEFDMAEDEPLPLTQRKQEHDG